MEREEFRARWEAALDRYGDMVYRLALVRTGHKQDAEDLAQDVFVEYARRLESAGLFDSEEHEKAWLLRVTVDRSKNLFASAWFRRRSFLQGEIAFSSPEHSDVYFAVQSLPENYRTVIHLHYYEGYPVKEIGELLGIKENTVKSLLKRGRERLRRSLG